MTLNEHLDDIRNDLRRGAFANEASVSQGIVLRLLHALGWPYNTQVVTPEYSVEGRRVDFALCNPPLKPLVFIEVKQVGQIKGAERQLFEYAFHTGVPIAILTDGREWHFFQPGGQGDYKERRVYKLDLIETDNKESLGRLNRYLNYELIRTSEAIRAIEEDYRAISKQRHIQTSLPEAWIKLVEEADELLIGVVAKKTESLCGYTPTAEQVLDFLKNLNRDTLHPRKVPTSPRQEDPPSPTAQKGLRHLVVTMPNGEKIAHRIGADTFVEVIEKLGIEKVKDLGDKVRRSPLILTSKSDKPNLNQRKSGRYYIVTHGTAGVKKKILEKIASELGVRLQVEIVSKD